MPVPLLNKRLYRFGQTCPKKLYLSVHHKDLAVEEPPSDWAATGEQIGKLARMVFPSGLLLREFGQSLEELAEVTRQAVLERKHALYEPTFVVEGLTCRADLLVPSPLGGWHLIEVKSGKQIKPEYVADAAFQALVIEKAGLTLDQISIAHVNPDYVYPGGAILPEAFFTLTDVTEAARQGLVKMSGSVEESVGLITIGDLPTTETNTYCRTPQRCPFFEHCHENVPADDLAFMPNLQGASVKKFRGQGKRRITDLADDDLNLPPQKRVRRALLENRMIVEEGLGALLDKLVCPAAFLDFEAASPALPLFPQTKPFQRIFFQFSCHVIESPGAEPVHHEFLGDGTARPDEEFLARLLPLLRSAGTIVHYSDFELHALRALAEEGFAAAREAEALFRAKSFDLLKAIKGHVYAPSFDFSFSIKDVLPALVPDLSYDNLPIKNGDAAAQAWMRTTSGHLTPEAADQIRKELLEYCALDTWAMVKLMMVLRTLEPTA